MHSRQPSVAAAVFTQSWHGVGLTPPRPPPYHPPMTTQKYRDDSRHLLAQARSELNAGDVRQASEKGWGAAAQILKAVAEQRGWDHGKHRHLSRVASRLRSQYGDGDIFRFYQVADSLHGNFYEDEFTAEDVAQALGDVESLLDKLEPLIGA